MSDQDASNANLGFLRGLLTGKSKTLGLVGTWLVSCTGILAVGYPAAVHVAALASGGLVIAAYVLKQGFVEAAGVRVAGARLPGPTVTKAAAAPPGGTA